MSRAEIIPVTFAVFMLAVTCGCGLVDGGDDARIVLDDNIDDVRIGDDTTAVIRKLGQPDHIALGDFAGVIFYYATGPHAGMSVGIWDVAPKGARAIAVSAPYSGTTTEGIGIGTARSRVIEVLGIPDSTKDASNNESMWDYYVLDAVRVRVDYVNSTVRSIAILL